VSELTLPPDGRADFHIHLTGLHAIPTQMQILSDTGGIWQMPFNNSNWVIALTNFNAGAGDLYFSSFKSNTFRVLVSYADASSDQADAVNQNSGLQVDIQRLLEQSTFGPTPALIASAQQSGIEGYLYQQLYAPMQAYPDLAFWPQTRPTSCAGD